MNRKLIYQTTLILVSLSLSPELKAEETEPIALGEQTLSERVDLSNEDGNEILSISIKNGDKPTVHLFDLENPSVTGESYAIQGFVRCNDVAGNGYLEMWNYLPEKAGGETVFTQFFSRTLAIDGPMRRLSGNQEWREFSLPALVNDGSKRKPLKLTLNVVLPKGGEVQLRDLKLVPDLDIASPPKPANPVVTTAIITAVISVTVTAAICIAIFAFLRNRTRAELSRIQNTDSI